MTDREMLGLAAKAAGHDLVYVGDSGAAVIRTPDGHIVWNPRDDSGDALRLAVRLRLDVLFHETEVEVVATHDGDHHNVCPWAIEPLGTDADAATRLAILRCAAEVGRRMT